MYKRSQVFAAACSGLLLFGMTLITLGSILPSLDDRFGENQIRPELLVALLPSGLLLGSLIFGPIADKYGYKALLILSVLVSIGALEGVAFTTSPVLLYVSIFFIGFGGGIINGGTSALVSDISDENKGANLSLLGVFFGIGALGMPLLLGLLSNYFSQQLILSMTGMVMLIPAIAYFFIEFPAAKQSQGVPFKEMMKLVKQPAMLLTGFFLFFQSGVEALISNWTTSFLETTIAASPSQALYALSFSIVGLTVGRLVLGGLMKRVSSFVIMLVSLLMVVAGCAILAITTDYSIAFVALIVIGAGFAGGFPVILGYIGQLYAALSGTAFSIALVIALTGNILINLSFGAIVRKYSIEYLPFAVMAYVLCMIIILFLIKREIQSKIKL